MKHTLSREYLNIKWNIENLTHQQIAVEAGVKPRKIQYLIQKVYKIKKANVTSKKYPKNENFFQKWSHDMAYILAFILCDGTINKNKSISIEINQKDIDLLKYINRNICPNNKIYYRSRLDKRTNNTYHQCSIVLRSDNLVNQLKSFGIVERKTGKEILPDIPKKYIPDFLRGVLDGDGTIAIRDITTDGKIYKKFTLGFCSASLQFLKDLQSKILFGFGTIWKKGNCYSLEISARREILHILGIIYTGNFCLKRKHDKYLDILEYDNIMKDNQISQGTCKDLTFQ
jgi:hypothetical protein